MSRFHTPVCTEKSASSTERRKLGPERRFVHEYDGDFYEAAHVHVDGARRGV